MVIFGDELKIMLEVMLVKNGILFLSDISSLHAFVTWKISFVNKFALNRSIDNALLVRSPRCLRKCYKLAYILVR